MVIVMGILMVIFVGVCLLMTFIILLQSSKGEGLASGIFGGAGMQSFFGGRGAATFFSKLTTGLAIAFIALSLILARFYGVTGTSPELGKEEAAETQISERTEKTTEEAPVDADTEESEQATSEEGNTTE